MTPPQIQKISIPEGTLVVLSGLPGAGKSYLKAHQTIFSDLATWLSSDELRDEISPPQWRLVNGRPRLHRNEAANDAVFAILKQRVRAGLQMGRTVVVDATSLTDADRKEWIDIANETGVPHLVLILDTPLDVCLIRAEARESYVSEGTIRTMHQPPAPQSLPKTQTHSKGKATPPPTPAMGFQRSSQYNFKVISDGTLLVFTANELPQGNWDVVGDVHGLLDELKLLLEKAGWLTKDGRLLAHPQGRKLLFLGDLVDRGPQSVETVRLVKKAIEDGLALCLKGNHEAKLVQFLRTAKGQGIETWSSFANAETGMAMLKLEESELNELTEFLLHLPAYLLDVKSGTAFVHADVHAFEPGVNRSRDLVYGMSGWKKVDSDALYQEGVDYGLNRFSIVRGHFPATSEQSHIFSLERHAFQKGELVLLRFDGLQSVCENKDSTKEARIEAFKNSLLTQRCEFDFERHSKRFLLLRGLEVLAESKLVTRQLDDSGMFRVFKYSKQTFWNNSWGESPLLLKARGIVLDPAGAIVSHPFDKCFNYLENGTGTDFSDEQPVIAIEKLNGFLGLISGNPLKRNALIVHTQGGFGGPFVGYIQDYLVPSLKGQILKFQSRNDVTLMFEVLHESDPHIIEYSKDMLGLHLIGVRGKGQSDQPWTEDKVDEAAALMGLRRPKWQRMTFGASREQIRNAQTEGLMVRADNERQDVLLKMKTPYYLTTKFLGRLSAGRVKHLFSNPKDFKKTMDEEFFVVVDALVEAYTMEAFLALKDEERVVAVRTLINQMQ